MIALYVRSSPLISSTLSKVCVIFDDIGNEGFKGRIYHPASGRQDSFDRVYELLMKLEDIFDTYGFPQHTHSLRSFRNSRMSNLQITGKEQRHVTEDLTEMEKEVLNNEKTGKATFVINVLFRQNATWQGRIQWVEKNKTQYFRSDLEMLKLMDDALNKNDNCEDDTAKWD